MSELTVEYGELPICVNCQLKHTVGLLAHIDPDFEKKKYKTVKTLVESVGSDLGMSPDQIEALININALEHKVEDALTVVRDLRRSGAPKAAAVERRVEDLHAELRHARHQIVDKPTKCKGGFVIDGKCLIIHPEKNKNGYKNLH